MTDYESLLEVPCHECGKPLGDHTMREYEEHGRTTLPFEETPIDTSGYSSANVPVYVDNIDLKVAVTGFEFLAGGSLEMPMMIFEFRSSESGPVQPVGLLVPDRRMLRELRSLFSNACATADRLGGAVARKW